MSQQPFSRPGAVDLSGLQAPASAGAAAEGGVGGKSYSLSINEQNFQSTLEASMTAPVLLVFYSPTRMPESADLARDLEIVAGEFEGRFLVGLVDIDAVPQIAQAMQIPSIPLVVAVIDGRPPPPLPGVPPLEQPRAPIPQGMQQPTAHRLPG